MSRTGAEEAGSMTNRGKLVVGCMKVGDTDYTAAGGLDFSANDFAPECYMNGLYATAGAGNVHVTLGNGGAMILPFTVAAADSKEIFRGYQIKSIIAATTTFSGMLFPVF